MTSTDGSRGRSGSQSPWLWGVAALAAILLCLAAPAARAEGHQADSDDYNCNHGAPDDPTTIEACNRLRGTSVGAGADVGHQRNSDDYNCNHGDPNDPATLAACQRLRGTTDEVGRDEGHQRNSDDWNCHHGAAGAPTTVAACARLRGTYEVVSHQGGVVVVHVVRDYGSARYVGGRAYRSVRYTVELNCTTQARRRLAYVRYSGHGATGGRVDSGRIVGSWRPVPPGALPYACR